MYKTYCHHLNATIVRKQTFFSITDRIKIFFVKNNQRILSKSSYIIRSSCSNDERINAVM